MLFESDDKYAMYALSPGGGGGLDESASEKKEDDFEPLVPEEKGDEAR